MKINSCSFSTDMAGYAFEITTTLTITNKTSGDVVVNGYIVLDGTMIDALPLIYPPNVYRQQFSSDVLNVADGNHEVDFYAGASTSNVQMTWNKLRVEISKA